MNNNNGRGKQQSQKVDTAFPSKNQKAPGGTPAAPLNEHNPFSKPIFKPLDESKQPAGALPGSTAANAQNSNHDAKGGADPTAQRLLILAEETASFYSIQKNSQAAADAKAPELLVQKETAMPEYLKAKIARFSPKTGRQAAIVTSAGLHFVDMHAKKESLLVI